MSNSLSVADDSSGSTSTAPSHREPNRRQAETATGGSVCGVLSTYDVGAGNDRCLAVMSEGIAHRRPEAALKRSFDLVVALFAFVQGAY